MVTAPNLAVDVENNIRILGDYFVGVLIKVMRIKAVKNARSFAPHGPSLIPVNEDNVARLLRSVAEILQVVTN
jgi:hypothetical protein